MEDGNVIWRVFQRNLCCISLIVLLLYDKGGENADEDNGGLCRPFCYTFYEIKRDAYKCYNCSKFLSGFVMNSLPTEQLMHHHHHH